MNAFKNFLKDKLNEKNLSLQTLLHRSEITKETYNKIIGPRSPTVDHLRKFAKVLYESETEREEFLRYAGELKSNNPKPILDRHFDDSAAAISFWPLQYEPFSGDDERFVDAFVYRMLDRAGLRFSHPNGARKSEQGPRFALKDRIKWLQSSEANMLVNLVSLRRMRNVDFHPLPIQISLNAVMIRPDDHRLRESRLAAAKSLIASNEKTEGVRFRLLAIEDEVGYEYLTLTRHIAESEILRRSSLDAEKLAEVLNEHGANHLLICDEITALATVRALKGKGMLVFQPASDESIAQSKKRGVLPAHALGLGLRRDKDSRLTNYLSDAIRIFLSFETESVASLYKKLYVRLVEFVTDCLSKDDSLYLAGVRKISKSELRHGEPSLETARQYEITSLVDQQARAFARRCLQLRHGLHTVSIGFFLHHPVSLLINSI